MSQSDIVVPVALQHTHKATCSSPWFLQDTEYPPAAATYQPLINGEEAFRAVHQAIAQATKTVDIVCWGFQPSMYFIRDKRAPCIGELLMQKAREGVQVRVLGWEMPSNLAGLGGEANLPGKASIGVKHRAMQHTTADEFAYDRQWFNTCSIADNVAGLLRGDPIPYYVSRGFSLFDRAEIAYHAKFNSLDPHVSKLTVAALGAAVTHHQKTVLVDYELADRAVGFVMGHNMLDEYWDTDTHTSFNRSKGSKPAGNAGPRGDTPRQDISSQVRGPILEHLHHNFATAWHKATGEKLLEPRKAKAVGPTLQCTPGVTQQLAQLVRTQAQDGKRDIERLYLQAVNNATQFIYIENQYFRWPPLAELIKTVAARLTETGRDPSVHGALHLFVITNVTDDSVKPGAVNTQRMLESLGRADTIPEVTKLRRIEAVTKNASAERTLDQRDYPAVHRLREEVKRIQEGVVIPEDVPGLKVHVCSLVAPDSPAGFEWMPVYVHSKLMIVDDVFTTHGSANINTRSMQVDSELNIAHEWAGVTRAMRRRLWNLHTDNKGGQDDSAEAFNMWQQVMDLNEGRKGPKKNTSQHPMKADEQFSKLEVVPRTPYAPLVKFFYDKKVLKDLD